MIYVNLLFTGLNEKVVFLSKEYVDKEAWYDMVSPDGDLVYCYDEWNWGVSIPVTKFFRELMKAINKNKKDNPMYVVFDNHRFYVIATEGDAKDYVEQLLKDEEIKLDEARVGKGHDYTIIPLWEVLMDLIEDFLKGLLGVSTSIKYKKNWRK